ncbi:hypothetical protein [Pseudomonas sp. WAC2]|uniref:hypothetical protein n=1 Tax=Pseudomonas sp. WAC2 TaxID=3055057 RepID=UPI0025AF9227|nr:hypothetical protein [Pseudomonas sp. WAC2]MDN3238030.1 hypothetical protein [Pseudomonas sp. WAC2]
MPYHHILEEYLHVYQIDTGIEADPKGPLFRTIARGTGQLTAIRCPRPMPMPW